MCNSSNNNGIDYDNANNIEGVPVSWCERASTTTFCLIVGIVFGNHILVTLMSIFVVLEFGLFETEVYLNFFGL